MLLQLLSEGSQYAFAQIFDNYKDRVYGVAYHVLKSHLIAEEIVQDVFMKIWLKRTELTVVERLDAFLFTVARNMTFDRLKRIAYEADMKKEMGRRERNTNDTDHRIQNQIYQSLLNEAVSKLPEQQKKVYLLSKESGLSHEEIGKRLNISKLTVKKHLVRALKFIRKDLARHLGIILCMVAICGV